MALEGWDQAPASGERGTREGGSGAPALYCVCQSVATHG